jgi:hypothetical protein
MKISLELPPGVALPTLNGTLVGELDDLHIQIRFKDLVDTLKSSVENGAGVHVSHNGQHIDVPALPKPVKAVDLVAPPDAEARAIGAGDLGHAGTSEYFDRQYQGKEEWSSFKDLMTKYKVDFPAIEKEARAELKAKSAKKTKAARS